MASGVTSWSQTAADNDTADSAVNYAEGQAPSTLNDAGRGLMSSVAKYRDDTAGSLTTAGTTTAYTATSNQGFASLSAMSGQELTVRFDQTNGASPTLNVDSLGAKALQIDDSNAVPTGMIAANSIWRVTYDNSIPAWIVNGVAAVFEGASVTVTGAVSAADLTLSDDATVGGDLDVTGAATAASLETTGDVTVGDDLAVTGDASVTGPLTADNAAGIAAKNTAKAYAYFTVADSAVSFTASTQGFNVASVTRSSAGVFDIVFTSELGSTNYAVIITCGNFRVGFVSNRATTGFRLTSSRPDNSLAADPTEVNFIVVGLS